MRFHSKYHNKNHHTEPTAGYPDSASDPIASTENPFKGDFILDGSLNAETAVFSNKLSNLEVDNITINNPITSLDVTGDIVVGGIINGDGAGLINITATSLGNFDSSDFQLISQKDQNGGYLGITQGGGILGIETAQIYNLTDLITINGTSITNYLTTSDLSSTVAPLIDDGSGGKVLPVDYLPDHNHDISELNNISDMTVIGNTSGGSGTPTEVSVIDNITNDASTTSIATSQAVKDYVDANGGGGSSLQFVNQQYGPITLAAYVWSDIDLSSTVGQNRALVMIRIDNGSGAGQIFLREKGSTVIPTEVTNLAGWGTSGVTMHGEGGYVYVITDQNGVVEIKSDTSTTIQNVILRSYQTESGGGTSGGGTSGGGSSSSLLRYGEIQVGDIRGEPTGTLTTTGDFTAVKTNDSSDSRRMFIDCTFNTALSNTNYNVLIEIISLDEPDTDGNLLSPIVYNKSTTGFTISQDETSSTQDLQFNVRIESTEVTPVVGSGDAVLQENGYQILPSGMIMQWGKAVLTSVGDQTVNFTIPFENACFNVTGNAHGGDSNANLGITSFNKTSFTVNPAYGADYFWQAIGN